MIPIRLDIRNFFSHRYSSVDFSLFDSALLIGNTDGNYDLSNGSGKSSIFESILWCLFNKARVATMDDIILWGEDLCTVELSFKQDKNTYKVKRDRSRTTGTSNVEFCYLSDDNDWIDISGSTAKLTNDKIISILKFDYKTFVNSAYFRQNDISEFAESDPGRKKEILKSIIDISKWDEYEKEAKSRLKNIKLESEILQSKVEEYEVYQVDGSKIDQNIVEIESDVVSLKNKYNDVNDKLEKMFDIYQNLKNNLDTDRWDKLIAENKDIKHDISQFQSKIKSISDKIESEVSTISNCKVQLNQVAESLEKIVFSEDTDDNIKKTNDLLLTYKSRASTAKSMIEHLSKNKNVTVGICNVCEQEITDDIYDKLQHNHSVELDKYNKELVFATNKVNEFSLIMKNLDAQQLSNKKFISLTSKLNSLKKDICDNELRVQALKDDLAQNTDKLQKSVLKYETNQSILDSLKNDDFQQIHKDIEVIKLNRKRLEDEIAQKNKDLGVLIEKSKAYNEKLIIMKKDSEDLIKINKRRSICEKMVKLLGKNGIQTILLDAVIEDLEKTANKILESICNEPLQILLETQRVGSDGLSIIDTLDLTIRKDGINQNFKSLSGGEQFRISLGLRIALSEISSKHGGSSLEFLLLDEINSPLDRHGTENLFINVIKSLESRYKILIITHNDYLKDKFYNVIEVTKANGESTTAFSQK